MQVLERADLVGTWVYDVASEVLRWSYGTFRIAGQSPETFNPSINGALECYAPESRLIFAKAVKRALEEGLEINLKLELIRPDGSRHWVRVIGEGEQVDGVLVSVYGGIIDFSGHEELQSDQSTLVVRPQYRDSHDQLTGLPNRHALDRELAVRLAHSHINGAGGWLLHLDLDRFKLVNEVCGYAAGDRLILDILPLLKGALQAGDLLTRFSGDKFALLIAAVSPVDAVERGESLIQAINSHRFESEGHSFTVGLSVGAAPLDSNSGDVSKVLRQAETSCQVAKRRGGDRVMLYRREDAQLASAEEDLGWGEEILCALDENRFELYAQRVVSIDSDAAPGYEVLVRLRQRDGTLSLPGSFLPAARRYGLMTTLDRRVVELVLSNCQLGLFDTYACSYLSVNLSALSLCDEAFITFLLPALARSGVPADRLRFEITESEALPSMDAARDTVDRLRSRGFDVLLDDFGNGFASFSYLRALKVDGLKIDNSYTRALQHDPFNQAVVSSICDLCAKLDLQLVAEGVEDEATLDILRQLKVREAQGWLFHRPEPLVTALQGGTPGPAESFAHRSYRRAAAG